MSRKQKKYHFIYKTINILTGRYYIGMHSTDNLEDRYLGSGTRLSYSINKYGVENHTREILEFCNNREELKSRELEIVNLNEIGKKECLNMIPGGNVIPTENLIQGGKTTSKRYSKQIRSEWGRKGGKRNIELHGCPFNDTNRFNSTGRKHSPDTIKKMKESKKDYGIGKNNSQFGTCWITNGIENKKIKKEIPIPANWKRGRTLK